MHLILSPLFTKNLYLSGFFYLRLDFIVCIFLIFVSSIWWNYFFWYRREEFAAKLIKTNKNKFINRHKNIYCTTIFSYYQYHNRNSDRKMSGTIVCVMFVNVHLLNCMISLDTQDIAVCSISMNDKRHHEVTDLVNVIAKYRLCLGPCQIKYLWKKYKIYFVCLNSVLFVVCCFGGVVVLVSCCCTYFYIDFHNWTHNMWSLGLETKINNFVSGHFLLCFWIM